ncbi:hypothetical protein B0A52_02894 [Exophiala mesophila]|uniref:Uncharacterized protein n=1 Tax=Exophiala mesophila TaxID=212818 RepID=A0A438NDY9_EXOME|nr:hypothetical protein B0A52_02894 [Exophiala mesophila]
MADRNSASSIKSDEYTDPVTDSAQIAMRADSKTLEQLSSSARAAQKKRLGKAIQSLSNAVRDLAKEDGSTARPEEPKTQ